MKNARNYWDSLYSSDPASNEAGEALIYHQRRGRLAVLKQHVPLSTVRILEAGCGIAEDLFLISKIRNMGSESIFVGIDFSINALRKAKRVYPNLEFVLADIKHLPFNHGVFDLVFNSGVIEHFPDSSIPFMEMIRTSRRCVISFVPNAFSWWSFYRYAVNFLAKVCPGRINGWPVWERSFTWYALGSLNRKSLGSSNIIGVNLAHYLFPLLLIEQYLTKKSFLPKVLKKSIMKFFFTLDAKPSSLSKSFGMELAIITNKCS